MNLLPQAADNNMNKTIRIGTRESQLAVWQAEQVKYLLAQNGFAAELVYIKSEGDIDLQTPLYEMGVQGVFTKNLDAALLSNKIDVAVHSMKDVPTQLAKGIAQAAVLRRGAHNDLLVYKGEWSVVNGELGYVNSQWIMPARLKGRANDNPKTPFTIATSSIRRKAQWLHRYPHHTIENLRGNVNTRLKKLQESNWHGAIFAAAGLERIGLRPENAIELDWMLPAPAQGAIMVACRQEDDDCLEACSHFNDKVTALCTKFERDFLRALLGGCSTPISALATVENGEVHFEGNILSPDGKEKASVEITKELNESEDLGVKAAQQLLMQGGQAIIEKIRNAKK
jgi:hydroxymethylbilane synthase